MSEPETALPQGKTDQADVAQTVSHPLPPPVRVEDLPQAISGPDSARKQSHLQPVDNILPLPPLTAAKSNESHFAADTPAQPNAPMPVASAAAGAPRVGGVHLGTAQVTATQHALRLKRENELLRASRESILADNVRLRSQLKAAQDLMEQIKLAMAAAETELNGAVAANRLLKQQVADLQRQQKRSELDTERMLESIRSELDDVLMREMTQQEN